jgi:hypothetical protein
MPLFINSNKRNRLMKIINCVLLSVIFGLMLTDTSTAQQSSSSVPLPQDINIVQPDSALDPNIKVFSGKWEGIWDNELPHILIVEKINFPDVFIIYALGKGTGSSSRIEPRWRRFQGVFESGNLKFSTPVAFVSYKLQSDGSLMGTHEYPGGKRISTATMRRID